MSPIIIQGIGYLALLFVVIAFQINNRVKILLFMLIGVALFVLHYALLGAWVGSLMNVIEVGTVFVAYKKETEPWAQKRFWLYFFVTILIIAGLLTAKSIIDVLPIIAQILGAIAVWQAKPKAIRFLMLAPRPLWFIYNWAVGSYAGMTTELFILVSILVGIARFDVSKRVKNGNS